MKEGKKRWKEGGSEEGRGKEGEKERRIKSDKC